MWRSGLRNSRRRSRNSSRSSRAHVRPLSQNLNPRPHPHPHQSQSDRPNLRAKSSPRIETESTFIRLYLRHHTPPRTNIPPSTRIRTTDTHTRTRTRIAKCSPLRRVANRYPQPQPQVEMKYDVKSARGGRGGRVTAVTSIWAEASKARAQPKVSQSAAPKPKPMTSITPTRPDDTRIFISRGRPTAADNKEKEDAPPPQPRAQRALFGLGVAAAATPSSPALSSRQSLRLSFLLLRRSPSRLVLVCVPVLVRLRRLLPPSSSTPTLSQQPQQQQQQSQPAGPALAGAVGEWRGTQGGFGVWASAVA